MGRRIASVVLNYDNYNDTIKCVDNMINLDCDVDIVIVDNRSTNNSYDILKERYSGVSNITLLQSEKNNGYSAGNNVGIKYIIDEKPSIDYICIMNPDTLFDCKEVLAELCLRMDEYDEIAVMAPVMCINGKKDFTRTSWDIPNNIEFLKGCFCTYKRKKKQKYVFITPNIAKVEVLVGAFLFIRKNVLIDIGLFDENTFLYSEENILGFQVKNLGMCEALCMDLTFQHNHPKPSKRPTLINKLRKQRICGNKSRLYICKKYYPKYMLPLYKVATFLNYGLIALIHIGGSIKRILKFK